MGHEKEIPFNSFSLENVTGTAHIVGNDLGFLPIDVTLRNEWAVKNVAFAPERGSGTINVLNHKYEPIVAAPLLILKITQLPLLVQNIRCVVLYNSI